MGSAQLDQSPPHPRPLAGWRREVVRCYARLEAWLGRTSVGQSQVFDGKWDVMGAEREDGRMRRTWSFRCYVWG